MPLEESFSHNKRKDGHVIAVRVILEGRVQKVGLRVWIKQKATQLELDGWVRNKSNETVEALFIGIEESVKDMIKLCHQGPSFAYVKRLREFPQADTEGLGKGFALLPTV